MKTTLSQLVRSPKFMIGFVLMVLIIIFLFLYPLFNPGDPLEMVGLGSFFKPGTYISSYDVIDAPRTYTLRLSDAGEKRVAAKLSEQDRADMLEWFIAYNEFMEEEIVSLEGIDIDDTEMLMDYWWTYYSPDIRIQSMIRSRHNEFVRLDRKLDGLLDTEDFIIQQESFETGEMRDFGTVSGEDYVNMSDVANKITLPLGTDNFGRDVLKQLVSAAKTSLMMGVIAGVIATLIGLTLGLLAGYIGGLFDEVVQFINNMFTVIPGFILLVLISYAIGQEQRGVTTVAIVIGCTSWVWTARSVRAQVISLRNRDHVNLSKLSGHSLVRIIIKDILPYIASYVVMAFVLQLSSAVLAEAGLSMLGLGPKTTEVATLGLMMNWAMSFSAHVSGAWWAYYPTVLTIALFSFLMNLMNTGMDQVFNPQLRES